MIWKSTRISVALTLVAAVTLPYLTHRVHTITCFQRRALGSAKAQAVLTRPEALRLIALGYKAWLSDVFFLRAVNCFGDKSEHKFNYPQLGPFLVRAHRLDPNFTAPILLAGTSLTNSGMDHDLAMQLLKDGAQEHPHDWRIQLYYGFNAYYWRQDFHTAAEAYAKAAAEPDAPWFLGAVASRLSAESKDPALGLELIDSLLATTHDEGLKKTYIDHRNKLMLELILKNVTTIVQRYTQKHGHSPSTWQTLIDDGVLPSIPEDPLGGYLILQKGNVATLHEDDRLRAIVLHPESPQETEQEAHDER